MLADSTRVDLESSDDESTNSDHGSNITDNSDVSSMTHASMPELVPVDKEDEDLEDGRPHSEGREEDLDFEDGRSHSEGREEDLDFEDGRLHSEGREEEADVEEHCEHQLSEDREGDVYEGRGRVVLTPRKRKFNDLTPDEFNNIVYKKNMLEEKITYMESKMVSMKEECLLLFVW